MAKRKPLTVEDVKNRIKIIKEIALGSDDPDENPSDYEAAYQAEIDLYKDVLKDIAEGVNIMPEKTEELAKEALKAGRLRFHRNTA